MTAPYDPIQASFDNAVRDFKDRLCDKELVDQILTVKTIDDVYDFTDKLQKEQANAGRLRNLNKIQPYLETLRSYAGVIEVFIQTKQDVLCLIWGPIKFLLQWADNARKSFDAVVDTLSEINLLLPEFQTARKLFDSNNLIKDVLVLFFRDILEVYLITLKFFRKTCWKIVFEALWTKQQREINVVKTQIERHTRLLRREVSLEHIQEAHNTYLQARIDHEKTERSLRRQLYLGIRADIAPETYEKKLDSLRGRTCRGTGQWLLADAVFVKWLDKADATTRILWLQGIPGAGKTFLASAIVHETKRIRETRTVYAFLSDTLRSTLSALSILHSMIFQLSAGQDDLEEVVCQSNHETLKESVDAAHNLLQKLLGYSGPTYIVLDGLDEIDELQRCRLLKELLNISEACHETRILISSRAEADIGNLMKDSAFIRVDKENTESIQKFVRHRSQEWFSNCDFLPEARVELELLLEPLAANAKGMFLYAEVVLRSLDYLDDMNQIKEELTVLPENLDAAYARILARINHLHAPLREKVRTILGWIGCTPTPLTVPEIEQALVVGRSGIDGDGKVIARLNLHKICGPIVEEVNEYVQFVHFTVKEYFFSPKIDGSIKIGDAILSLATCCVSYLCQTHHDADLTDHEIADNILSGSYRLQNFAATTWLELVECYFGLNKQKDLPHSLICVLEVLARERNSETYTGDGEASDQPSLNALECKSPDLYKMLCNAVHFRQFCWKQDLNMNQCANWVDLDPLTISDISIRVHKEMRRFSCQDDNHENCHCKTIRRHYGPRPFKCELLNCPSYRRGFESLSLQRIHAKQHDRPWKCSHQDCEFATGGFLSRKMRDAHFERYHSAEESKEQPELVDADANEFEALILDLITADNVGAVRSLASQIEALPSNIRTRFCKHAAACGSCAMVDFLLRNVLPLGEGRTSMLISSIKATNVGVFGQLLSLFGETIPHLELPSLFENVLNSESVEVHEEWEKQIDRIVGRYPNSLILTNPRFSIEMSMIKATAGIPHKEGMLLAFWEKIGLQKARRDEFERGFRRVIKTTCSVNLAKYFMNLRCDVDSRRSGGLTPLRYAARNTTAAGAEMMEYLLLCGADPEASAPVSKLKIGEERGAKNISKWLGISWDELVAQTKEQRENAGNSDS